MSELKVPLVAHNSGMHTVWQLGSGALLDRESRAPRPVARCGLWLPQAPPLCIGFSSISNYSRLGRPPHCAHWFCLCPRKLILGISMKLVGLGGFRENSNTKHPIKLYLRDEKTPVVF